MVVKQERGGGGEESVEQRSKRKRRKKKSFLYLTRKTPLLLCIGRGEKHMGMEVAWRGRIKDPSVDDFTIWFFGNTEYLYGMGNHLKIQTKSIFRRFYGCFVAALQHF